MGKEPYKLSTFEDIENLLPYGPCFGVIKGYDYRKNYLIDTKEIYDLDGNHILTEEERPILFVFRRKKPVDIGELIEFYITTAVNRQIIGIDDLI
jgi:hypothetical protein